MRRGHSLGSVHVRVANDGMSLDGLRSSIAPGTNFLSITPIHMHRVPAITEPASSTAAINDAATQHDAATC